MLHLGQSGEILISFDEFISNWEKTIEDSPKQHFVSRYSVKFPYDVPYGISVITGCYLVS